MEPKASKKKKKIPHFFCKPEATTITTQKTTIQPTKPKSPEKSLIFPFKQKNHKSHSFFYFTKSLANNKQEARQRIEEVSEYGKYNHSSKGESK